VRGNKMPASNKEMTAGDVYVEAICRKLRLTAKEYEQRVIENAVIVGWEEVPSAGISGHTYVHCPAVSWPTLGNVDFEVARFFEDA